MSNSQRKHYKRLKSSGQRDGEKTRRVSSCTTKEVRLIRREWSTVPSPAERSDKKAMENVHWV